jgi:hypothetical protein
VGTNIPEAYANGSSDDQAFFQNLALFLTGFFKTHISLLESTPDHQAALLIGAIASPLPRKHLTLTTHHTHRRWPGAGDSRQRRRRSQPQGNYHTEGDREKQRAWVAPVRDPLK